MRPKMDESISWKEHLRTLYRSIWRDRPCRDLGWQMLKALAPCISSPDTMNELVNAGQSEAFLAEGRRWERRLLLRALRLAPDGVGMEHMTMMDFKDLHWLHWYVGQMHLQNKDYFDAIDEAKWMLANLDSLLMYKDDYVYRACEFFITCQDAYYNDPSNDEDELDTA